MASTTEGKRPLSPHLTVYRLPLAANMSILHRASGCFMALSMALVVWWFLGVAGGPEYFAFVDGWVTSWLGFLVLLGSAAAFFYHMMNGIRHLWWDTGGGFELDAVTKSGFATLAAAALLTLVILIVAL